MIGGGTRYDAGELIHTDFLWDAHGADAGEDIRRWTDFAGTLYEEPRTERLDDLMRTLEMQLGVPYPVGADEMYGNANRDLAVGDIAEVRLAAVGERVHVLIRTTTMHDPDALGVLLLADTGEGGSPAAPALGLPEDHRFDVVLPIGTGSLGAPPGVQVAADAGGWTNTLELAVPAAMISRDGVVDLSIITGAANPDGTFTPHNIAFRHAEPIDIYTDRLQAFALHGGAPDGAHLDQFSSGPVALADLRGGRTQAAAPGPGYHERHMISGENISREQGRDGRLQPYGLYIPSDFDPAAATPATVWLHYRGGKAHSGATINPRLIHELAREDLWRADGTPAEGTPLGGGQGNVVITPHGRGTSAWYVAQSHQDVFEVLGDVHELLPNLDPQRRYLAGYSMGGYGTYLFGLLYPDMFAAGFPVAGAVTQGAWTGVPPDSSLCGYREPVSGDEASPCFIEANEGDADAQLTYRLLDNARHLPLHIDHGTNDELVPVTGVQRMAARLVELGYRVEMQTFAGYEHFTQAAADEWADGAAYLQRFSTPADPRQVTYRVVPALVHRLNTSRWDGEPFTFAPDGAWWVDDIVVRDADPQDPSVSGLVDLTATGIAEELEVPVPVLPGPASPGHSTPFTRHGLDRVALPGVPAGPVAPGVEGSLTGVASLSLDAARMGIDLSRAGACGTLTTDGPTTVRLEGIGPGRALVAGPDGATVRFWDTPDATLELPAAGTWALTLDGGGAVAPTAC
jgi:dienelactone hydrolase